MIEHWYIWDRRIPIGVCLYNLFTVTASRISWFRSDTQTRPPNKKSKHHCSILLGFGAEERKIDAQCLCWWASDSLWSDHFMEILESCRDMSGDFCNLLKDQREKEAKVVCEEAWQRAWEKAKVSIHLELEDREEPCSGLSQRSLRTWAVSKFFGFGLRGSLTESLQESQSEHTFEAGWAM